MYAIVDGPIDVAAVRRAVSDDGYGAILVFEGVARDHFDGRRVVQLEYEAWASAATAELRAIGEEAIAQVGACSVAMVHRTGAVAIGEPSVVIAVGTPHRDACYAASRYCIEQLKQRVAVWKKEVYEDGSAWKANAAAEGAG